jgi:hypothetical protein
MKGQMGKKQGKAPDGLPDTRRFFVKTEEGEWAETTVQDLVPDQVIAVVDEAKWSPKDVDLWTVYGIPYIGKQGLWTVEVNAYKVNADKE